MNGKQLRSIFKGCSSPTCARAYQPPIMNSDPASWVTTTAPAGPAASMPLFEIGDYVWSDDPCMRQFIRGTVVWAPDTTISPGQHVYRPQSDYIDYVKLALDGPMRNYAMINGGRLRVKRSRLLKVELLERFAFDASLDGKRRRWPSAERIKMAIS